MRFTTTFRGKIRIAKSSSTVDRSLSDDDFEFLLDSISDVLNSYPGLENLSVGASLQAGELEVTFVVDAANLVAAQQGALSVFNKANVAVTARLANRIGGQLNPEWTSIHTDLIELIPA